MIVGTNIKTGKGGDLMASINKLMKKLQAALNSEKYDKRVKINTRQFFSEEQRRVITMYAVVMPVFSAVTVAPSAWICSRVTARMRWIGKSATRRLNLKTIATLRY